MGPQGVQGPKGDTGAQGPAGTDGPQGPAGPMGPQGLTGPEGPKGDMGAQGPPGAGGAQGAAGAAGAQGAAGPAGAPGAAGPQGPQGDAGPQGPQGDAGPSVLPSAKEAYLDGDVSLESASSVAVTAIRLPAGSYMLQAKTSVVQTAGKSAAGVEVRCTLNGDPADPGSAADTASTEFGKDVGVDTLAMTLTTTLASPSTVVLRCRRFADDANKAFVARETKIVALPLQSTTRVAAPAGASGA